MGFLDYERYDALGLAELVRSRKVQPSELVACALERIDRRNPALNAVVHRMDELAQRAAKAPLPDSQLAGVPFLLKDQFAALAGQPLTYSSRLLADYVPDRDSELVARYRRAGLIFVGRTNMPEFGLMPVTEPELRGAARNPWDSRLTPGGSSGGSAAAVAAGIVPMAHGSDGGGSLRIPASCCGLFGMKPSRGRNPHGPQQGRPLAGLLQEHVVSRTVRDSAAALDATHGPDLGAQFLAPPPARSYLDECRREPGQLRIAVSRAALFGEQLHGDCQTAVTEVACLCSELGHIVEEAQPELPEDELAKAFLAIFVVELAHGVRLAERIKKRVARSAELEDRTRFLRAVGRRVLAEQYIEALDQVYQVGRVLEDFLHRYDLLLTSTLSSPPVPLGFFDSAPREKWLLPLLAMHPSRGALLEWLLELSRPEVAFAANTIPFNMSGQPAVSIPLYWNSEGVPIGVELAARLGRESILFRISCQLERARPWFDRRPPARSQDCKIESPSG